VLIDPKVPASEIFPLFLIERDTDPTRLSPDNATMMIAVLCVDNQVEVPQLDPEARRTLQRLMHRNEKYGGDGRGHVILVLRCILESTGNEDALVEPIVHAVWGCLGRRLPAGGSSQSRPSIAHR
jgi:hypothetical protein